MLSEISAELLETMKKSASVLKRAEIPFVLAGGFAAYARGGTSSDHDVDYLLREQDVEPALAAFAQAGFRVVRPPEDWLVKVFDDDRLVDLIFRPVQHPVTDEVLADSEVMPVNAVHLPVLSATRLMEHKLLTFSQHHCDFARALPLARSLREQIEWDRVRANTKESVYAQACLYLLSLLEVIPPQ
ncbi:hypothetical protein QEZ54_30510 [Catellatospora sp. KI3]|uniref:hypothetical protein n=1 Tax=Catellatospora sp. KI3 TaxID=3041620 RepID=UPI0024831BF1|nr:hypothetical protein [Catellatospora sp. KI3]MDI1465308.1 hypothetical protein [Catellatospora sp. KI3]